MAGDFEISVRTNVKEIQKSLDTFTRQEVPYATALAINSICAKIIEREKANFKSVFDRPTPFTLNALGFKPASKLNPTATIFMKDAQEKYLEPYEYGGKQIPVKPGNVAVLNPIAIGLNQYGNIPQNRIKQLLGLDLNDPHKVKVMSARRQTNLQKNQRMYFTGVPSNKPGAPAGLWQRLPDHKGLKLIVKFADPKDVHQHLDYYHRAQEVVDMYFDRVFLLSVQHASNMTNGFV